MAKPFNSSTMCAVQQIAKFSTRLIEKKRLRNGRNILSCIARISTARCFGRFIIPRTYGGNKLRPYILPSLAYPRYLVRGFGRAFLGNEDNCPYLGNEDALEVPEVMEREVF